MIKKKKLKKKLKEDMPQLDKFTFGPQVFWLVVIFFALYFILVSTGLPRLYKIFIFRKKKLLLLNKSSEKGVKETFFYQKTLTSLLENFLHKLRVLPENLNKAVEVELLNKENLELVHAERINTVLSKLHDLNSVKNSMYAAKSLEDWNLSNKKIIN